MPTQTLGTLQRVDLRTIWQRESEDFTPWLAQPENLAILGETVGLELELQARERQVGPYRADILCKDLSDDTYVLIENQLESTDHTHLGQLMTYAAGLDAVKIIWVAESFTEEHRAAVDWLNRITEEKFNFFGLEIELWKIGDSLPAPKFNMVCKPNDWSRTVQQAAQGEITPTKQQQLEFWTAFADYLKTHPAGVNAKKPLPQQWMNHAIGRSGFQLASIASKWNNQSNSYGTPELRVEMQFNGINAKEAYAQLLRQREEIERQIGEPLTWHNPENAQACRIYARIDGDFRDKTQWPKQHEWLREHLALFNRVFAPMIKSL